MITDEQIDRLVGTVVTAVLDTDMVTKEPVVITGKLLNFRGPQDDRDRLYIEDETRRHHRIDRGSIQSIPEKSAAVLEFTEAEVKAIRLLMKSTLPIWTVQTVAQYINGECFDHAWQDTTEFLTKVGVLPRADNPPDDDETDTPTIPPASTQGDASPKDEPIDGPCPKLVAYGPGIRGMTSCKFRDGHAGPCEPKYQPRESRV